MLGPGLALHAPPTPVRADDLSDAVAEQQRLAKLIAQQQAQLAKLQAQQATMTKQIAATRHNLAEVRTSIDEDEAQIADIKGQMVVVRAHYESVAAQQALLEARLAQLTNEQNAMQRELEVRQQILAARLAAAYETDQTPLLQQILTAHSLTEALSDVSYYGALSQADKALADEIKRDQEALAQIRKIVEMASVANTELKDQVDAERQGLDDAQAQLAAAEQQLADLKAMLETQLAEQQAAEAKLAANQAAMAAAIRSNGQAMDDLGARIDQIVAQQGGGAKIPSEFSGTLTWPMGGRITQEYGCTGVGAEPRVGSCRHFHQGIDIAAPCLTPVHAAAPGVVVFVGYNPYDAAPQAWLVIVAHSTSMVTWYAHMTGRAPPGIYVGAQVAAGQLVGTENTTGHSTGCHLHWAVRVNGVFMNPRMFV
ncbi:MAG: peptidoglycan DD-metalloendopeptidase family protein [Candidatus Limnocylindrales bacterium]